MISRDGMRNSQLSLKTFKTVTCFGHWDERRRVTGGFWKCSGYSNLGSLALYEREIDTDHVHHRYLASRRAVTAMTPRLQLSTASRPPVPVQRVEHKEYSRSRSTSSEDFCGASMDEILSRLQVEHKAGVVATGEFYENSFEGLQAQLGFDLRGRELRAYNLYSQELCTPRMPDKISGKHDDNHKPMSTSVIARDKYLLLMFVLGLRDGVALKLCNYYHGADLNYNVDVGYANLIVTDSASTTLQYESSRGLISMDGFVCEVPSLRSPEIRANRKFLCLWNVNQLLNMPMSSNTRKRVTPSVNLRMSLLTCLNQMVGVLAEAKTNNAPVPFNVSTVSNIALSHRNYGTDCLCRRQNIVVHTILSQEAVQLSLAFCTLGTWRLACLRDDSMKIRNLIM
ncbi:uncharacterized protein EV420DRAFT_1480649 [Desarmillaria tabescens]|uniref:Uncharacterized protein n=1 Tax=Armillaria tabescens TaxID=1929756 RepID=A0AA39KF09_ARMTA|nr:uncharacterized protein EV420DRAFT_1480649 [Desarmillaria tabescens]KAK0457588.1 hypothetical protein EV420DRAFT_1480649 [Desarmillaria tabescens]